MKIVDEELLDRFRRKPACEWCLRKVRTGLEPHHILSKGMGGATRMDHQFNLISLCLSCHRHFHDGNMPRRAELLSVVAMREGLPSGEALLTQLYLMRRS